MLGEMRSFGFDGTHFVEHLETSVLSQIRRGRLARRNRYIHYCCWAHALMRNNIGPPEAEYSFPQSVLTYIRYLAPGDIKGEIREHGFQVSISEFCTAMEIPQL
ncbi:hypothetical protein QZH41_009827 [Actinostola sp. cb2023]|nr:hypothetical protein QZH41_009827 [Actinostola sp. cb2023]